MKDREKVPTGINRLLWKSLWKQGGSHKLDGMNEYDENYQHMEEMVRINRKNNDDGEKS